MENPTPWILETARLNPRGQASTERELRRIYDSGDEVARVAAARFLYSWRSKRGYELANEWFDEEASPAVLDWILVRYSLVDGWPTFDRFKSLLVDPKLPPELVDCVVDRFSDLIHYGNRNPRYKEGLQLIARQLSHPSPEVRWTAIFSLAKIHAANHRDQIARLTTDEAKSAYGYVSRAAKNALRHLDGEPDVDLHDASSP